MLAMEDLGRQKWVASLLYELTTLARDTYTVGGDGLDDPDRMRRFNELIRRTTSQLHDDMHGRVARPYETFLKMVGEEVGSLGVSADKLGDRLR